MTRGNYLAAPSMASVAAGIDQGCAVPRPIWTLPGSRWLKTLSLSCWQASIRTRLQTGTQAQGLQNLMPVNGRW